MWRRVVHKILLWVLIGLAYGQFNFREDCSDAPTEELRQICLRLRQMDANARRAFESQVDFRVFPPAMPGSPTWQQPIPVPWNSRGQVATHPYECMTLACLCPFFAGTLNPNGLCILQNGSPLTMAYRKEYRMMTDDERNRFHNALRTLKMRGEFDRFATEHRAEAEGSGAHSGPGFLPWHREYTKRFEIALRLIDPSIGIPFWDNVMDGYLPDPRDSIMFSDEFMGQSDFNGNVVTGPFAFWRTIEGNPAIRRNLGLEGQLFTENQVNMVLAQTNVEYVLAYTVPIGGCPYPPNFNAIEYSHSNVHLWLGGDMKPPLTSANDPIFYTHHSFIDMIWENWRLLRQPRWVRESAYPPDLPQCASPMHFSYARLAPYNLILRDGLSNSYTDQLYRYAPRPTCSVQMPTCGSRFLFCDTRIYPHCVAKIKLGGLCRGFEGFDACYMGQCIFGRCVPGPTPAPWRPATPPPQMTTPMPPMPPPTTTQAPSTTQTFVPRPQFVNCFNRHPCCELWADQGECQSNRNYMAQYCQAACRTCNPSFNATNECTNRHVSCVQWQRDGQCRGNSEFFMHENCRDSCGLCSISKRASCARPRSALANAIQGRGQAQAIRQGARRNGRRRLNTRMQARKIPKPANLQQPFRHRQAAKKKV